ncbi:hypothetical protein [Nostoc sp.]|uniref:hypothetical protein n=1 Tax=Nostoc sp. TaxID=1180 RepID=UPI003FA57BE0
MGDSLKRHYAIAVDTEKARSEVIINLLLLEVRRIFNSSISVFSGEEFNVDASNRNNSELFGMDGESRLISFKN